MSKMILSRWNPRAEDREGSKKKGGKFVSCGRRPFLLVDVLTYIWVVHESRLRPYIHVSPSEFAEYGQPRFGEAVRLFRESDVQFLDVSFHRILEGNPNAKAWEEIENPDVMGLAWDGDDPIMFARLMGFGECFLRYLKIYGTGMADDKKTTARFKCASRRTAVSW